MGVYQTIIQSGFRDWRFRVLSRSSKCFDRDFLGEFDRVLVEGFSTGYRVVHGLYRNIEGLWTEPIASATI